MQLLEVSEDEEEVENFEVEEILDREWDPATDSFKYKVRWRTEDCLDPSEETEWTNEWFMPLLLDY